MFTCPPLCCHEPWFALSAVDDDTDDVPGIVVILSDAIAELHPSVAERESPASGGRLHHSDEL